LAWPSSMALVRARTSKPCSWSYAVPACDSGAEVAWDLSASPIRSPSSPPSAVHTSKHTDLGHFATAGGMSRAASNRPRSDGPRWTDRPWPLCYRWRHRTDQDCRTRVVRRRRRRAACWQAGPNDRHRRLRDGHDDRDSREPGACGCPEPNNFRGLARTMKGSSTTCQRSHRHWG
jgi:hypothetical protein